MSTTPKNETVLKQRNRPKRSPVEIEAASIGLAFRAVIFEPEGWESTRLTFSAEELRTQLIEMLGCIPSQDRIAAALTTIYDLVASHEDAPEFLTGDFYLPFVIDYCDKQFLEDSAKRKELVEVCGILASRCLDRFVDRLYDIFNKRFEAATAADLESQAAEYLAEGWAAVGYAAEIQGNRLSSENAHDMAVTKHSNNQRLKRYMQALYIAGMESGEYENAHQASVKLALSAQRESEDIWEEHGKSGWKVKNKGRAQQTIYRWFLESDAESAAR